MSEMTHENTTQEEETQPPKAVRVVDAPLAAPAANLGLLSVFHRRYLLRLLVRREVQSRYQGSFLGFMWSYINPMSQFFIYWFVIGHIMGARRSVENYPIHLFSAIIIVHFFTETFGAGTRSIVKNKALVTKMAMPKEMFPVSAMLVSLYHVGPQLVILVLACLAYGWVPDPGTAFGVLLALGIIMTLGTALALIFSVANVYFRDFGSAVAIMSNIVRFGVPMVYPYSQVHAKFGHFAEYYLLNPIAHAVLLMQRAFWVGTTKNPLRTTTQDLPHHLWLGGIGALVGSCVLLLLAQWIFNKTQNRLVERL